ncbi:MAG TPA: glycosyltransferase [Spirochaetia bacterium]|nr:glycosyltransferase [Spirochaetia bacterium]
MARPGKLLTLSVSAGAGHMRAAQALARALAETYPPAVMPVVDTSRYVSPFLQKVALGLYLEMVRVTPRVYGYIYRQLEDGQTSGRSKVEFNRVLNRLTAPKLARLIAAEDPAALVCTNPIPLGVLDYLKSRGKLAVPVVAAVTDFTIHSFWVFDAVDLYLVADEALVPQLVRQGIAAGRVAVTGIPIDPVFAGPLDREEERGRLGLAPDVPCVLIMGGGLGLGPLEAVVQALGQIRTAVQLLVVAGNNTVLKGRVEKLAPTLSHPCRVFGFVQEIHRLMGAADLMIGKAGGLSCAEALAMGLPIFIIDPIPGQEERNAEFLVERGAAVLVGGASQAAGAVERFLQSRELRQVMASAARGLGRPMAAQAAVRAIASLVGLEDGGG